MMMNGLLAMVHTTHICARSEHRAVTWNVVVSWTQASCEMYIDKISIDYSCINRECLRKKVIIRECMCILHTVETEWYIHQGVYKFLNIRQYFEIIKKCTSQGKLLNVMKACIQ